MMTFGDQKHAFGKRTTSLDKPNAATVAVPTIGTGLESETTASIRILAVGICTACRSAADIPTQYRQWLPLSCVAFHLDRVTCREFLCFSSFANEELLFSKRDSMT